MTNQIAFYFQVTQTLSLQVFLITISLKKNHHEPNKKYMYIHDIFSDIFNFLFKKRRDKIFIHCTKTCACVFNACIKCKIRYPIKNTSSMVYFLCNYPVIRSIKSHQGNLTTPLMKVIDRIFIIASIESILFVICNFKVNGML